MPIWTLTKPMSIAALRMPKKSAESSPKFVEAAEILKPPR